MGTDEIIMSAMGGCCCFSLIFAVFMVILGTFMKWRIGVNFSRTYCWKCDEPAPAIRAPSDGYEMLWGGWTCSYCNRKNDKWGRRR